MAQHYSPQILLEVLYKMTSKLVSQGLEHQIVPQNNGKWSVQSKETGLALARLTRKFQLCRRNVKKFPWRSLETMTMIG